MRANRGHAALPAEDDAAASPSRSARELYTPPDHFPLFQVCVLFFASLTGALPLTSLFPYVANMVVDLGAAPDVDRAGFVSGYVASAFMFGRLLSSFYWGHVADSIGRKPVIYISCISIFIFSICFGLSVNIWMALVSRFLLGFLNPLSSLTKTLISEICSKEHQPMGMAVAAGSWSVGLVVGPALGGSLARSAELYPGSVLDTGVTRRFPYLLPNAVTALFGLASLVLIYLYLPETMAPQKTPSSESEGAGGTAVGGGQESAVAAVLRNATELMKDRKVRTVSLAYFSISLSAIIYDECLPLWALSSESKGGLGMNSAMIGNVTSITGIPMLVFTFVFFPILSKRFGDVFCFRYAQLICNMFALLTVVLSAIGALVGDAEIPVLVLMASGEKSFACVAFTANFLLINESVSAERRGSVNGFVMTIGGIAKTLGPMLGATFYAWSINNGVRVPPFNFTFVFMCCFLIGSVTMLIRFNAAPAEQSEKNPSTEEDIEMNNNSPIVTVRSALHQYSECYDRSESMTSDDVPGTSSSNARHFRLLDKFTSYLYGSKLKVRNKRACRYAGVGLADRRGSDEVPSGGAPVALSPLHHHIEDVLGDSPEVVSGDDDFEYSINEEDIY